MIIIKIKIMMMMVVVVVVVVTTIMIVTAIITVIKDIPGAPSRMRSRRLQSYRL